MSFTIITFFILITGLCIGSFLNVVIIRTISGESIVFPASKCPKCQHPLKWWHNIPVISYVILRGRCGFCKEKISLQYPVIEILTSLVFILAFFKFGLSLDMIFALIIGCLCIILAETDRKEQVVYDVHTYSLIGTGLLYAIISTVSGLWHDYALLGSIQVSPEWFVINPLTVSLLGLIAGFVIMEIISRIGYLIAGERAFGEGDSYIAAGLGAIFGWRMILPILILSVIIQVIITLPIYLKKEFDNKNWMALISLGIFILYSLIFYTANSLGWLGNNLVYILCTIVLCAFGIFACIGVLKGMNTSESRTYLPFGPALLAAGLIFLLV